MRNVITAVLGGGQGSRLWPLTRERAKPAVPVGGKFRLIDIPISNSLHAGIDRIYVLTQFNSASLHRHIVQTYHFDIFNGGFVDILAAEQGLTNRDWYQGTADAVRQNLHQLTEVSPTEVLVLSGDQLYLMRMEEFVASHRSRRADISIALKPVRREDAPGYGIMRVDSNGRIVEFVEKPSDANVLDRLTADERTLRALGLPFEPGLLLASMGIYVFKTGVLSELLLGSAEPDFGRDIIPAAIHDYRVYAFPHSGYWRDIGTIPHFHQANLELALPMPPLDLYDPKRPIFTHGRFLPGTKVHNCAVDNSILCEGSIISGSRISESIIGIRAMVREGAVIERSVIMGANSHTVFSIPSEGEVSIGIGRNCEVKGAIVDFNARIGDGSKLLNVAGVQHADADNYCIRGGIIVVPRDAVIEPGTEI
ncbi:MAG: sugar phosphate nucleotidyltransferase [Acidobacteriota bacterium]